MGKGRHRSREVDRTPPSIGRVSLASRVVRGVLDYVGYRSLHRNAFRGMTWRPYGLRSVETHPWRPVDLLWRVRFPNVVRIRPRNTVVGVPFTPGKFDHSRMAIEYFRPRYGGPKQRAKRAGEYRGRTAFVVGGRRTTGQNRGGPKQRASEVQRSETPRSKVTPSTGTCKYFKTFASRALRSNPER